MRMIIVAVLVSLSFGCALSPEQKAECRTSHMARCMRSAGSGCVPGVDDCLVCEP
jgi:hypothetical protein